MENTYWRFGVAANIAEYHTGEDGKKYRGTKPFSPGTKVYLGGKVWDSEQNCIGVVGRNRFGRVALEFIPLECLENVRTQRIFKPCVLRIIDREEAYEGWEWWGRTSQDRKDARDFVKDWNNRLKHKI